MPVETVTAELPSIEYDADDDKLLGTVPRQISLCLEKVGWLVEARRRGSLPLKVYVTVDPSDRDTVAVFPNSCVVPSLDHPGPPKCILGSRSSTITLGDMKEYYSLPFTGQKA